ncbi:energy transducer TonB [uncultured Tenacibaculum sp.]|uniref:energy transducer TonB n=1 Tax=uncultured Tenacibaculum sp. TaxID=174713 RepID=UPI00261261B4|nr:energy transducer TonB [uncultured Tenacibaculum sp.]
MRKLTLLLLALLGFQVAFSQEVCTSKSDVESINEISNITKCIVTGTNKIDGSKKASKVIVVSNRSRHKRRLFENKEVHTANQLHAANINIKAENSNNQLKINDLKSRIAKINNAIEEENSRRKISFDTVDQIPQFQSCSDSSLSIVDCFNHEMQKHLVQNIVYPEDAIREKITGDIWISFVITNKGTIKNIITTGPKDSDSLEKEAIRVVSLLPKFIPGKQNNKDINVTYTFPISFNLDNSLD